MYSTDFVFALISRNLISESSLLTLLKIWQVSTPDMKIIRLTMNLIKISEQTQLVALIFSCQKFWLWRLKTNIFSTLIRSIMWGMRMRGWETPFPASQKLLGWETEGLGGRNLVMHMFSCAANESVTSSPYSKCTVRHRLAQCRAKILPKVVFVCEVCWI